MTAQDFGELLMRNERNMQMAAGGEAGVSGGAINSLPRRMIRLGYALLVLVGKSASAHPRSASVIGMALTVMLYIAISAPRTGVVLSTKPGIVIFTLSKIQLIVSNSAILVTSSSC